MNLFEELREHTRFKTATFALHEHGGSVIIVGPDNSFAICKLMGSSTWKKAAVRAEDMRWLCEYLTIAGKARRVN